MGVDSATNDASRVSADVERAARIAARLERAASSVPPRMPLPPTTKLALETVEALFADHGSDLARARCRAEMFCAKRENERVSDLVYGEFGFMALASVLAKHRDAMPETGGVFLDLGSGIGRPLFYAAALAPRAFRDVVGVEIQPGLHELATEVTALYDAEVRPRLGGADAPRVKCLLGDFLSAADEKDCGEENDATRDAIADAWANADLVLVNSCCFGDALFQTSRGKPHEC
jgi:SAM-dependent methyltransferase